MAVLTLVIDRGAALDDLLQGVDIKHFTRLGGAPDLFGKGERGAAMPSAIERSMARAASSSGNGFAPELRHAQARWQCWPHHAP